MLTLNYNQSLYLLHNFIDLKVFDSSRSSEKTNSKNPKRKSAISGSGTRFNIMQSLKDIDEKILGPEGKKDTGVKLNDKDFLNGFLEGFNDTQEEVFHRKILVCLGICTLLVSIFLTTYYILFYLDIEVNAEY